MSVLNHQFARVSDVTLHYVTCGDPVAPAVLLLHGYPQTWYEWRHTLPALAEAGFFAIAPDMRG